MAGVWVVIATAVLTLHQATATHIVNAPWGPILGMDSVGVSGLNYMSYLGIPYALSPVGNLRFAKPVAHPGFRDGQVFNATTPGDQCLQLPSIFVSDTVGMSEDCLTLNVYVPESSFQGPKSVMVWIHGGAFSNGGAPSYTPSELVTENGVIVVVIQYRLDAMGFLSCADEMVAGNFGLWDQNLAIRWVKTNIGAFGGDPESMTVFGHSAGSVSVGYQMLSPASKDLSFSAIMQSGTPLAPWALNKNPCQAFFTLASETGCLDGEAIRRPDSNRYYFPSGARWRAERERVLACLRSLDAMELIRVVPSEGDRLFLATLVWVPVVDGDFVPQDPAQLTSNVTYLKDVGVTKRDVMLGVTNDEGALYVLFDEVFGGIRNTSKGRRELLRSFLVDNVIFLFGEDLLKEPQRLETLVGVLEFFYTQWSNNGARDVTLQNLSDVISDIGFVLNTVMFARDLASAKVKTPAFMSPLGRLYLYLFDHFPAFKADRPELRGTAHADDLSYEFDFVPEFGNLEGFTDVEDVIGVIFRTMLTSFAMTGEPLVPLFNSQTNGVIAWPEFTLTDEKYLSLQRVPRVERRVFSSRVALWTDLIPTLLNSALAPKPARYWLC